MQRPFALSPSRAREYLQCPLKFRFSVIDKIPQLPTDAQIKGTVVHEVLEDLFDQPQDKRTAADAQNLLPSAWEKVLAREPDAEAAFPTEGSLEKAKRDTQGLVDNYFRLEVPSNLEPARTEEFIEVVLRSGLAVRGVADRVDEAPDGALRVVDYKTGKAPSPRFMDEALFQMRFYALMLKYAWRLPKRLQLLYLRSVDVLTLDPRTQDIDGFEDYLQDLWEAIERDAKAGTFAARRTPLCGWCDYQELCPLFGGTPPPLPEEGIRHVLSARRSNYDGGNENRSAFADGPQTLEEETK